MTAPTPPPHVTTREAIVRWFHDVEGLCRDWEDGGRCDCAKRADRFLASGAVVAVEDLAADEALVEAVRGHLDRYEFNGVDEHLRALAAALTARAEAPK